MIIIPICTRAVFNFLARVFRDYRFFSAEFSLSRQTFPTGFILYICVCMYVCMGHGPRRAFRYTTCARIHPMRIIGGRRHVNTKFFLKIYHRLMRKRQAKKTFPVDYIHLYIYIYISMYRYYIFI